MPVVHAIRADAHTISDGYATSNPDPQRDLGRHADGRSGNADDSNSRALAHGLQSRVVELSHSAAAAHGDPDGDAGRDASGQRFGISKAVFERLALAECCPRSRTGAGFRSRG